MGNNGLLIAWLLGTMSIDVLSSTFGLDTAFFVWSKIEEQLLNAKKKKKLVLTDNLTSLKKGNCTMDDYIKQFNSLCDNLYAIG